MCDMAQKNTFKRLFYGKIHAWFRPRYLAVQILTGMFNNILNVCTWVLDGMIFLAKIEERTFDLRTFPKQLPSVTPFEQLLLITTLIPLATAGFTRKSRRRPLITSRGNFFRHTFTLKRGMDEDGLRKRYLLPGQKKGKEERGENLGGLILY